MKLTFRWYGEKDSMQGVFSIQKFVSRNRLLLLYNFL